MSSILALGAVGLAALAGSAMKHTCRDCGGSLARAEDSSVGDMLYQRRYTEPSLFLVTEEGAKEIGDRWDVLKEGREHLEKHTRLLSEDAMAYGLERNKRALERRQRKISKGEDPGPPPKSVLKYASDWQQKQKLGREFVPEKLLVPCGTHVAASEIPNASGSLEARLKSDLRLSLDIVEGEPRLVVYERASGRKLVVFGTDKKGAMFWPYGLRGANLFSATSKMSAPSFSLPAGRASEGGTCAAEGFSRRGEDDEDVDGNPLFDKICSSCYALKGHYGYLSNVVPGTIRKAWVAQELRSDPTGETLGRHLASAISFLAKSWVGDGWTDSRTGKGRSGQEIGVWDGKQLLGPKSFRGTLTMEPLYSTPLEPSRAKALGLPRGATTNDIRKLEKVPKGAVAGFFRIHDSGDFSVPGDPGTQRGYINAWRTCARLLPHVVFWAPTRIWVIAKSNRVMLGEENPPNFVVRPSAINVDESPPVVPGLAAGTGVNTSFVAGGKRQYVPLEDTLGREALQCPVYSEIVRGKEAKSCMAAGCRACWLAPNKPVTYGKH